MSETTILSGTRSVLTAADLTSTSDAQQSVISSATSAENLTTDFNTFLTLLTAQVTNQDPLQPLDSTQFVEQLATFSGLEQQVASNAHLEDIIGLLQQSVTGTSSALLGQEAAASSVEVSSGAFAAQAIRTDSAVTGQLVVRNQNDEVIYQSDTAVATWSWNGTDTSGNSVAAGTYRFEIQTADGVEPAFMVGEIDRVITGATGLEIGFAEGVRTTDYIVNETS